MTGWDSLDDRLRPQVAESTQEFERVRPALEEVTRQVQASLGEIVSVLDPAPLFVTARTKSVESFREKASRTLPPLEEDGAPVLEFPDPLRNLTDLVGVRIITTLTAENARVANL